MRIKIRNGVFETNSSSTHSLSLCKVSEEDKKNPRVSPDASFEIRSPLAKLVWFFAVVDEAEENFDAMEYRCGKSIEELVRGLVDKACEIWERDYDDVWCYIYSDKPEERIKEDFSTYDYEDLNRFLSYVDDDYYDNFDEYNMLEQAIARKRVLEYKECLIEAYCKMEDISRQEALDRINKEAHEFYELDDYIKDENTHDKAVTILHRELYSVKYDYKDAEDKKKFLEDCKEQYEKKFCGSSEPCCSCTRYFMEGSLDECDCGFERYAMIDDKIKCSAEEFLSDDYTIVAYESFGRGAYHTDKIY